jgi:two-component system LytT family response regulator
MIKAIIVDDEQHCINRINELIKQYYKYAIEITAEIKKVELALEYIKTNKPELIFLDVEIGDKTGFDFLNHAGDINANIIFTTAHNKYAVQAFKFSAIDYLLKPVEDDDFQRAIEKIRNKTSANAGAKSIEALLHNIKSTKQQSKKINVPTITGFEIINVSDIVRCQSDVNYTTIFLNDKKNLMVAKTLKEFEELLTDYNFFRVHNSHLINLNCIKSYNKGKGGYVTLTDGKEVEVSTRRKEEFLKAVSGL